MHNIQWYIIYIVTFTFILILLLTLITTIKILVTFNPQESLARWVLCTSYRWWNWGLGRLKGQSQWFGSPSLHHLEGLLKRRAGLHLRNLWFSIFWSHFRKTTVLWTYSKTLHFSVYNTLVSYYLGVSYYLTVYLVKIQWNILFVCLKTLCTGVGHDTYSMFKLYRRKAALYWEKRPNERSDNKTFGAGWWGRGNLRGIWTRLTSMCFPTCLILCRQPALLKIMDIRNRRDPYCHLFHHPVSLGTLFGVLFISTEITSSWKMREWDI